jgi:hypothetical protein
MAKCCDELYELVVAKGQAEGHVVAKGQAKGHVVAGVPEGGHVVAIGRAKGYVPVGGALNCAPSEIKIEIDLSTNWKSL